MNDPIEYYKVRPVPMSVGSCAKFYEVFGPGVEVQFSQEQAANSERDKLNRVFWAGINSVKVPVATLETRRANRKPTKKRRRS